MKAAVYYGRRDLRIEEDVPVPEPGPGELLLEVHAVGICGTDAGEWDHGPVLYAVPGPHPVTGHAGPLIPGHELSGRVVAVGPGVDSFAPGATVACGGGFVARRDEHVERGRPALSPGYATIGLQRNGGLAQYVTVPAESCIDLGPYGIGDDAGALAQPMAIAVHSLRRGRPRSGEDALVIGAGGIGAFLIYAAAELGLRVAVAEVSAERLEIAARLGAARTIVAGGAGDLTAQLAEAGIEPALVYEVTGTAAGLEAALAAAEPAGARIVLTGIHDRPRELDLRRVTLREVELIGANAHVWEVDLPEAVRLLASRREGWGDIAPVALPLEKLVEEGILPMVERRATRIKTLIDPWAETSRPTDTVPRAAAA